KRGRKQQQCDRGQSTPHDRPFAMGSMGAQNPEQSQQLITESGIGGLGNGGRHRHVLTGAPNERAPRLNQMDTRLSIARMPTAAQSRPRQNCWRPSIARASCCEAPRSSTPRATDSSASGTPSCSQMSSGNGSSWLSAEGTLSATYRCSPAVSIE